MKSYPTIERIEKVPEHLIGTPCIAFEKLDGSNVRAQWTRKHGWHRLVTRGGLDIMPGDVVFGDAYLLFQNVYADPLSDVIRREFPKVTEFIAFLEFFGPHSFAGLHTPDQLAEIGLEVPANEPKQLVLFDVNPHKQGILGPERFLKLFGHLPVPQVVYRGPLTERFIMDVREGKYPLKEGVVCKGGHSHDLWMVKAKTYSYIEELKKRFGVGWQQYV